MNGTSIPKKYATDNSSINAFPPAYDQSNIVLLAGIYVYYVKNTELMKLTTMVQIDWMSVQISKT